MDYRGGYEFPKLQNPFLTLTRRLGGLGQEGLHHIFTFVMIISILGIQGIFLI